MNVLTVSQFVEVMNKTFGELLPVVEVEGEVSEFRISKEYLVYFKLVDEESSVQCFCFKSQLNYPIEDGMKILLKASPNLHKKNGFSLNLIEAKPSGEGSLRRAYELLKKKLTKEGLFDQERKQELPDYPTRIGLISSSQAAGYEDFISTIKKRWGLKIELCDVRVQGEKAPEDIIKAIEYFNSSGNPVEVICLVRGGGGLEDLAAYNSENVVRAIAASRIPTIVGVGHTRDISLADMVADKQAITPTNAAEILVPDKSEVSREIDNTVSLLLQHLKRPAQVIDQYQMDLEQYITNTLEDMDSKIEQQNRILASFNPKQVLARGYSIVRNKAGEVFKTSKKSKKGQELMLELSQGNIEAEVKNVDI